MRHHQSFVEGGVRREVEGRASSVKVEAAMVSPARDSIALATTTGRKTWIVVDLNLISVR